ncbi:TraT protein [Xenorhabdus mauleonii]|uniref:TraT protein n=1 Tax=Xenorhabdus mauleonii TaxID=351675 RepID=A0A1I3V7L0_9GAMM|nr:hypothetical protein [Xenorhabdus mauleonii]PHM37632.1 TraT protein [Xenorhabdus mauleonii]SFJ90336.1 hypothetical protein SAMN05421680_11954 [Xenorhabdus mauleonii]
MLIFSISRHIMGHTISIQQQQKLNDIAKKSGHHCEFCGYESQNNSAIFRDNNPLNTQPNNLSVADPLCQAWRQLDTVTAEAGAIVYLPALNPEDVNHLQRAIVQALDSDDESYQKDAKALLNWLTSYEKPVQQIWGTSHPQAFGEAIKRITDDNRPTLLERWRYLALVLHPAQLKGKLAATTLETSTTWWGHLYRDYCSRN